MVFELHMSCKVALKVAQKNLKILKIMLDKPRTAWYNTIRTKENTTEKENKKMTRRELAETIAKNMKQIKENLNIERTINALLKGMTTRELEIVAKRYENR